MPPVVFQTLCLSEALPETKREGHLTEPAAKLFSRKNAVHKQISLPAAVKIEAIMVPEM